MDSPDCVGSAQNFRFVWIGSGPSSEINSIPTGQTPTISRWTTFLTSCCNCAIKDGVQDGRRCFASTSKKDSLFPITQSNVNRFSKFCHLKISTETFYEIVKIVLLTLNALLYCLVKSDCSKLLPNFHSCRCIFSYSVRFHE